MTLLTKSRPVALLGEAPPRVLVEPAGAKANSWEDVADLSARAGVVLDEWQELILKTAMGERRDNTWAAKRVGVTVPRQNGKSQLLVSRALAGALLFGEKKIVISAHQQDTAREAFNKLLEILEDDSNAWLMDRVKPKGIMNAINRESVRFKNGATIQFKARSGAAGKGFSSDCLMLDEAQILSQRAWVSINSTMSAMQNPQVWLLGTSPQTEDDSEVFESIRTAAMNGKSSSAAWCEWGADPSEPDYDPASEYTRWSANPAWNTRINHEVVDGEFETYPADKFAQDRLGIWLADEGKAGTRAISAEAWKSLEGFPAPDGTPSYGVAFSIDGERMSLAGGFKRKESETVHVELIDEKAGEDVEGALTPLADWFIAEDALGVPRWRRAAVIILSGSANAGVLRQMLRDRKVPARRIVVPTTPEYLQACEMTRNAATEFTMTHLADGQKPLDDSIAVCDRDKRGGWTATVADRDETPTEAISLALWGARTHKAPSTQSSRTAVVL